MSGWSEVALAEAAAKCSEINSLEVINGELVSQLMVACYHGNTDYVQELLEVPGIKLDLQNGEGRHALMCAAELGHVEVVELILKACQSAQEVVNLQDKHGITALMFACKDDNTDIVNLLLRYGAVVDIQDSRGWSALMIACLCGCIGTVSILIQHGADVNLHNDVGYSPLKAASQNGHNKIASLLIQHGAFVLETGLTETKSKATKGKIDASSQLDFYNILIEIERFFNEDPAAIVAAASAGDFEFVEQFLIKNPSKVNEIAAGMAAIHLAASANNLEVVKTLMKFNPNLEVKDCNGSTALHHAASRDNCAIADLLINAGASINTKNNEDVTPMLIAAMKDSTHVLKMCANHPSALLSAHDKDGNTALHKAVIGENQASVAVLLNAKADPTLLNFHLATPIHQAAITGCLPALELFIQQYPGEIGKKQDNGFTALHLAATNDHPDIMSALINYEVCDVDEVNNKERTALHLAVQKGHFKSVERLVGLGCNMNVQDMDGNTALHITMRKKYSHSISSDSVELIKVQQKLKNVSQASVVIACFLVQEGAKIMPNRKGESPLQFCTTHMAELIGSFSKSVMESLFHGSLRTSVKPLHSIPVLRSQERFSTQAGQMQSSEVDDRFSAGVELHDLSKELIPLLSNLKLFLLQGQSNDKDSIFFQYYLGRVHKIFHKLLEKDDLQLSSIVICQNIVELKLVLEIMQDYALKKLSEHIFCEDNETELSGLNAYYEEDKATALSKLTPMSMLPLIQVFFFRVAATGCVQVLYDSKVVDFITAELVQLNQLASWKKDISWFLRMSIATLFEIIKFSEIFDYEREVSDALSHLCIHEDIELRLPAKFLYSMSSRAIKQSYMLELDDLEITFLVQSLKLYTFPETKWSRFKWVKGEPCVSLNLRLDFLFLIKFFEMNSNNCLHFIDANPFEILTEMAFYNKKSIQDKTVELVSTCILHSRQHKQKVMATFDSFLQLLNMKECFQGLDLMESLSLDDTVICEQFMNKILYTMRYIMSTAGDDLDNSLAEKLVQRSREINYVPLSEKDNLCIELIKPISFADEASGRTILLSYLRHSSLPFMKIFCVFMLECFNKIFLYDIGKRNIIPAVTLLRLERVLIFFYSFCQHSGEFCELIAKTNCIYYFKTILGVYHGINSRDNVSEVTRRLPELVLFLLSTCATLATTSKGYFYSIKEVVKSYLLPLYPSATQLLAKCVLCSIAKFQDVAENEFELNYEELKTLHTLLLLAAKDKEGDCSIWIVYTLTTAHYLHFLLLLSYRLCLSSHNAKMFAECVFEDKSIFDVLAIVLGFHKEESIVVKNALLFLEALICLAPVKSLPSELTSAINSFTCSTSSEIRESAHMCLQCVRQNTFLTDITINLHLEKYEKCIDIINERLKSVPPPEEELHLMKILGTVSFIVYDRKRNAGKKTSASFEYAKKAASCLGVAYDNNNFTERSLEAEQLDMAMNDIVANQDIYYLKIKPLVRCLLCKKKCKEGEKIIRSHIWPNCCLKGFTKFATNLSSSLRIFDTGYMNYGSLLGPGQISYPMLCRKCENTISQYERLFKSKCFDKVYNSQYLYDINPEEIPVDVETDWFFLFCVSMIFRVLGLAIHGSWNVHGNCKEIYQLFVKCRKVLLKENNIEAKSLPQIGLFLTPVHELLKKLNLSPAFISIIFSKGIGTCSNLTLMTGDKHHDQVDFLWCSIGAINIVAGVNESCFNLVPLKCTVIPGQKQFVIPSSLQRYLSFPQGLLKNFERLAEKRTNRVLNTSEVSMKQEWMFEEFKDFERNACVEIAELTIDDTANYDQFEVMLLNYLPKPFNSLERSFDAEQILPATVLIHSTSRSTAGVITSAFVVTTFTNEHSVCVLLQICVSKYVVWIAYSLSAEDYSVQGILQCRNKKIMNAIEKKFSTRSILSKQLDLALSKTGFSSMSYLARWMHINWLAKDNLPVCDVKCMHHLSHLCSYCGNVPGLCNVCMKPATHKLQLYCNTFVQVCSDKCKSYLTAEEAMPLQEIYNAGSKSFHIISLSSNANAFSIVGPKGKVIIEVTRSDNTGILMVLCTLRHAYQQKNIRFHVESKNFEEVAGDNNNDFMKQIRSSRIFDILGSYKEKVNATL